MKRLIAILAAAFALLPTVWAQETVTGIVVDKNGNPLPGVKIEIPGTPDQTISDLDGSFSISLSNPSKRKLLASYAGMNSRKMKLKDGMKIKMSESNWWTQKPDEWNWFVDAVVAIPNTPGQDFMNPAYGLMVGRVKKFGYYVKGVTNTFGDKTIGNDYDFQGFVENEKSTYWSVSGGGIIRLGCPIHLYVGAGYANYKVIAENLSGDKFHFRNQNNFVFDLGLMLRIKQVTLSLGISPTIPTGDGAGNFGIGYSF